MIPSRPHGGLARDGAIASTHGVPESIDRYTAPRRLAKLAGRRFHVMAKPAGSACNLDCAYCF